jgi:hypothetical protein
MIVEFHSFSMSDVDDIDVYVAEPIWQWQQTEHGRWVMAHAEDLKYYTSADLNTFGHRVSIRGKIQEGPHLTEYLLRYGK